IRLGAEHEPQDIRRCRNHVFDCHGRCCPIGSSPCRYGGETDKKPRGKRTSDLKMGRGMGLALAAELNGYPGPLHVLELADQMGLSGEQRAAIQKLFDSMKAEAVRIGERLLAQEADLEPAICRTQRYS